MTVSEPRIYRFGPFRFDARSGEIRSDRGVERLAPKPARTLTLLLEHAGRLVERETFQEALWPDTVVEFDKGLNFCIREVRNALGDRASDPTWVETLPRRGYRFIASVEVVDPEEGKAGGTGDSGGSPSWARRGVGILTGVAAMVLVTLTALPDGGWDRGETDRRARDLGEMGGYLLTRGEGEDVRRSVDFFRRAIAADPGYGRAYSGLGNAYLLLSRRDEGMEALRRSLELDPELWPAHLSLAFQLAYVDYRLDAAGPHFRRALELAPEEVVVHHTVAWYEAVRGDLDSATGHMGRALELDPVSPRVNGDVGRLSYLAGRHEEAVAQCRVTGELIPDALRPGDCAVQALVEKGALEEARAVARETMEVQGAGPERLAALADPDPTEGLGAYWRWAGTRIGELAREGEDSHVHAAAAWARIGEADRAFAALENAYRVRCPILPQIPLDPALAPLRGDPRFTALLRRMGLSPARGRPVTSRNGD